MRLGAFSSLSGIAAAIALTLSGVAPVFGQSEVPRTAWDRPDLGGIWDFRTITPMQRPEELGEKEFLTEEEEIRRPDATKGWRRNGYVIEERRLVGVLDSAEFSSPPDLLRVLPNGLPDPFTTKEVAELLGRSRHLAQEVAYCLRESEAIQSVGRDRRGHLYHVPSANR